MAESAGDSASRQRSSIFKFTGHTLNDPEAALASVNDHNNGQLNPSMSEKKPRTPRTPRTPLQYLNINVPDTEGLVWFWRRFTRTGKKKIGVMQSLRAFLCSSCTLLSNPESGGKLN
jgi:hypothetical protein